MTTPPDCERARMNLMASLDGERPVDSAGLREHVSSCASCQEWLNGLESLTARFQGISYDAAKVDLWPAVQNRIHRLDQTSHARQLWPIAAALVTWRALQLFMDLPLPALHMVVPLAAAAAVLWRIGGDRLRIETSAPELQERGI